MALTEYKTIENGLSLQVPEVTVRYQYDNHLGIACIELDETAQLITYEEYHPFGATSYRAGRSLTETSLKRYKYVGKERDEETGLYYYGMRYYADWLCRFVSVDPLQFKYPHYTTFQYAGNKPVSFIDLDGAEEDDPNKIHIANRSLSEVVITGKKATSLDKSWSLIKGFGKGFWEGMKGTWNFFTKDIFKAKTWKATGNMLLGIMIYGTTNDPSVLLSADSTFGTNTFGAISAIEQSVVSGIDTIQHGTWEEKGKIIGEAAWAVTESVIGSKGVGALSKAKIVASFTEKLDIAKNVAKIDKFVPEEGIAEGVVENAAKGIPALRAAYVKEVEGLSSIASKMRAGGSSSEEIARVLHGLRRELGVKYKSLTPDNILQQIYKRNLQKYGDKLGPSIDYLRQQGKSWDDIINSATRTGGKDLGF